MFFREREVKREQEWLRKRADTEAAKSREVAQFLKDMLDGVGPSVAMGRDQTMLREILDQTAERIGTDLMNQPEVEIELRNTIGFIYWELGRLASAKEMYRSSLDLMRKLWGNDRPEVAATLHNLSEVLRRSGALQEAAVAERQALTIYRKLFGDEHPDVAISLAHLAFVVEKREEAEILFRQALAMTRKLLGDEHAQLGICMSRFGRVLQAQGKLLEAETTYREAVAIQAKLLDKNTPDSSPRRSELAPHVELAWTLNYLSEVLERQSKVSEAEAALEKAATVITKVVSANHPDRIELLTRSICFKARHDKRSEAQSALEALRRAGDKGYVLALNNIAWFLATAPDSSMRQGLSAVAFAEEAVTRTERKNPNYLDTLAAAYADAGEFAKAASVQNEAIAGERAEELKKEFEARLKLYQSNTPYRVN
jgi:tetratricopeptide (TPR) repeat protein